MAEPEAAAACGSDHPKARFHFSVEKRRILVENYDKGMNSTSKRCETLIEECARSIDSTVEQVKVTATADITSDM